MEDLNLLKKTRAPHRSITTKLCTKIDETLKDENVSVEDLEDLLEQLKSKSVILKELDDKILPLLKENEIEGDVLASSEYEEKIISLKTKLNRRIRNYSIIDSINGSNPCLEQTVPEMPETKTVKLPKLYIPKFYGEYDKYLDFWNQFESSIHKNPHLSDTDKFSYLKSLVAGTAANAISGFALSAPNYAAALKILESRFGSKSLIINAHMNKLLNLESVKNSSNTYKLRKLYDDIKIHIRSLESLEVTSGSYGNLLCPILLKLLPDDLNLEFNRQRKSKSDIDINQLLEFIEQEIQCREATELINETKQTKPVESHRNNSKFENRYTDRNKYHSKFPPKYKKYSVPSAVELLTPHEENSCLFCDNAEHKTESCFSFTVNEKREVLRKQGRCYICLFRGHLGITCKNKTPCPVCSKIHHVTLCYKRENSHSHQKETIAKPEITNSTVSNYVSSENKILLQTAVVELVGKQSNKSCRLVYDTAGQRSFVLRSVSKSLSLEVVGSEDLFIHSFQSQSPRRQVCSRVKIKMKNRYSGEIVQIEALEVEEITHALLEPPDSCVYKKLQAKGITLADLCDESVNERNISILIGADYYWKIVSGKIERLSDSLVACESKLGWVLMGCTDDDIETKHTSSALAITSLFIHSSSVENLWKLDTIGICDPIETQTKSEREQAALNHFKETISINEEGRYEIELPWVKNKEDLKTNLDVAEQRCRTTTNRLFRKKGYLEYEAVFDEWLNEGIIEDVPFEELEHPSHYLPHRGVYKEHSTTKVRPVFDASCRGTGSTSLSLNDFLEKGPNLLEQIPPILNRFRKEKIGVISDIRKAFLQISVSKKDQDYLRFLWWKDIDNQNFRTFRHKRVVFGLNCSPFLLAAVINHHLEKNSYRFPETCHILRNSFYVDNCVTSVTDEKKLDNFINESTYLLKMGGFDLRGWENTALEQNVSEKPVPVLGLLWDKREDVLFCNIKDIDLEPSEITRRNMLSAVHKIFDTIGILCPSTLIPKLIVQKSWKLKVGWDVPLPDEYQTEFKSWIKDASLLSEIRIPRSLNFSDSTEHSLHIFCDGSKHAYAAVVYLRTVYNGDVKTHLVQAKSRVTPLRKTTIPRIELLACSIGARLAATCLESLDLENVPCFYWTDSSTALTWIKKEEPWGVFVENRVKEIRRLTNKEDWRHIPSALNAADLPSRGCSIKTLVKSKWWQGPPWMRNDNFLELLTEPKIDISNSEELLQEQRKIVVCTINETPKDEDFDLLSKFSSWTKLKRVTAWCLRFLRNSRMPRSQRDFGFLTISELDRATNIIVRIVQKQEFVEEYRNLKKGKNLSEKSKLLSLTPFIDKEEVLRVGGRLRHSNLTESQKHPIIIPKKHHITDLIIKHYHETNLHAGTQLTVSSIRQKFWIINSRDAVKRLIFKCMKCFRTKPKSHSQLMADLPVSRVIPERVFAKVGIDFAGPFMIKARKGRGLKSYKCYVCLFVCFTTKAVHLEIVNDLTSEAFLASLKRFVARRGKPRQIYSDRGTNFVGAERELNRLMTAISSEEGINRYFSEEAIEWKFNPPAAPHFGGLWEAGVKQMKGHLKRTVGEQILTYEEFLTLINQIESCLNSRPIVAMTNDAEDLDALTPGHFLIGAPLNAIPQPDTSTSRLSCLDRWKLTQKMFDSFWKRWSSDYLSQLQQRSKWLKTKPNLKLNDLVIIKEDNQQPLRWKLGRIIELYPGTDGNVRVVKLRTLGAELKRPITKLCPLPFF